MPPSLKIEFFFYLLYLLYFVFFSLSELLFSTLVGMCFCLAKLVLHP